MCSREKARLPEIMERDRPVSGPRKEERTGLHSLTKKEIFEQSPNRKEEPPPFSAVGALQCLNGKKRSKDRCYAFASGERGAWERRQYKTSNGNRIEKKAKIDALRP